MIGHRALIGRLIDNLPLWLWHDGNLYNVPGGTLHFCVDHADEDEQHTVRTIEFARTRGSNRTIARGREQFPFDHPDLGPFENHDEPSGFISAWRNRPRDNNAGHRGATA